MPIFLETLVHKAFNRNDWRLVEDKLLNMFLRSELNECRSKEESKGELKVMVEIGSCRHF